MSEGYWRGCGDDGDGNGDACGCGGSGGGVIAGSGLMLMHLMGSRLAPGCVSAGLETTTLRIQSRGTPASRIPLCLLHRV